MDIFTGDQNPTSQTPVTTDSAAPSVVAPEGTASPETTSVASPETQGQQPEDSSLETKLAEAEKRLKDTQAWGHENAQKVAQLTNELNAIFNHPAFSRVVQTQIAQAVSNDGSKGSPAEQAQDADLKRAWIEYNASPNDEAAFANLVRLSEERGATRAVKEMQKILDQREERARLAQRNQLAAETINKAVATVAPEVPIELFWAMAGRAEAETPSTIADVSQRIEWQVNRAIELSRGVLGQRVAAAQQNASMRQAAVRQGAAVMPSGGQAPVNTGAQQAPGSYPTLVDVIKAKQAQAYATR
jgi:hypothetical protein